MCLIFGIHYPEKSILQFVHVYLLLRANMCLASCDTSPHTLIVIKKACSHTAKFANVLLGISYACSLRFALFSPSTIPFYSMRLIIRVHHTTSTYGDDVCSSYTWCGFAMPPKYICVCVWKQKGNGIVYKMWENWRKYYAKMQQQPSVVK